MRNRILLIEDNTDLRETIAELLMIHGYEVSVAANGLEGLYMATTTLPAVILSDIHMPGLDGYELTAKLQSNKSTCGIPVILASANFDRQSKPADGHPSVIAHLPKPFDEENLLACLVKALKVSA